MKMICNVPDEVVKNVKMGTWCGSSVVEKMIANGTPLSKIIDSLKELSKDHRHNYVGNSYEERAWKLGIEDSIDLILAESEDKE